MSDPTYGFGAAGVRLCPDPLGSGRRPVALGPALAGLGADLRARGVFASLGSGLRLLPGLALGAVLILALVQIVSREHLDASDLQVVRFEPAPEPLDPPEPLLPPAPVPQEEPAPPEVVAKREPPPPQPRVEPPVPPKPQPALPPIARRTPPPPQPAAPRPAPPRQAPPPKPRPDLRIDAVARAPAPAPPAAPAQLARAPRPTSEPAARPAFPLAMPAAPTPGARPAAAPRSAPRPEAPARTSQQARTARPSGLAVAPLAAAAPRPAAPPAPPARVARQAPSAAPRRAAAEGQLRGVPLGSLAACVTDRREDELKLRVMAERGSAGECASNAGRYRFVETRNLNAFLMWVERAPTRRAADRCVELSLALECLAQQRGRSRST